MGTLAKIFKARKQILEGVVNSVTKNELVEAVAEHRMNICKTCEHYDGPCTVPGSGPCCGACGCTLKFKTRSLTTVCGIVELDKEPLWLPAVNKATARILKEVKDVPDNKK
jgi:hypothetical protein